MNKEQLHEFRKEIDANIQKAGQTLFKREHERLPYHEEMCIVRMNLIQAKMWVGKCLEKLGSELPKEFQDKAEDRGAEKPEEN